jgi:hypothetical protein
MTRFGLWLPGMDTREWRGRLAGWPVVPIEAGPVETQTVKPQPERPKDKKPDNAQFERFEDLAGSY